MGRRRNAPQWKIPQKRRACAAERMVGTQHDGYRPQMRNRPEPREFVALLVLREPVCATRETFQRALAPCLANVCRMGRSGQYQRILAEFSVEHEPIVVSQAWCGGRRRESCGQPVAVDERGTSEHQQDTRSHDPPARRPHPGSSAALSVECCGLNRSARPEPQRSAGTAALGWDRSARLGPQRSPDPGLGPARRTLRHPPRHGPAQCIGGLIFSAATTRGPLGVIATCTISISPGSR